MSALTPMFRQYRAIKQQYPDVLLLFRLGDFYEMFGEDAVLASRELELTLTSREIGRGNRVPMCGVPHHAVERYLAQLIAKGYKAALCDQMEDARKAKGLVRREVTRVVTPGTVVEDAMLPATSNNFLCALANQGSRFGLAAADVSTGEFYVTEMEGGSDGASLIEELSRLQPSEVLASDELAAKDGFVNKVEAAVGTRPTPLNLNPLALQSPRQRLLAHFGTTSLEGFGCDAMPLAIEAAAMVLDYLSGTQLPTTAHLLGITTYSTEQFMTLDAATQRNLELTRSLRDGSTHGTLLALLDRTATSMGGRLLRRWLLQPLLEVEAIRQRHEAVDTLLNNALLREEVSESLKRVLDLERLTSKAATATANPRDLAALRRSLAELPRLKGLLSTQTEGRLHLLGQEVDPAEDVATLLDAALVEDPPALTTEGGIIREGYHADLDALRLAQREGKNWIAKLEAGERERTGIKSLKVGFNQVFGYYIEVTKPNLHLVPTDYHRKQTTAGAERYVTPELKEKEALILGAEERSAQLEQELFSELRQRVGEESPRLLSTSRALAELDVLTTFAWVARQHNYVRPEVNNGEAIALRASRHPVVEAAQEEPFVPNDVHLDSSENQLLIVTGPNMAGKSTYLRQIALAVLLAQIGSFVPASSAAIGVVDRVFTRVGAQDDLTTGRSTFMVEMNETANILHNATHRSLVLLDEIGRGTSTYDGLSIAWAVAERIHDLGAKTLFATHYHHLNELESLLPRARNLRVAVKEEGDHITFLRQIVPGATDRSYGIQVARLAGLPQEVIERAKEILWTLEGERDAGRFAPVREQAARVGPPVQLRLFELEPHPVVEQLKLLNVDAMTPVEALTTLAALQKKAAAKGLSGK